MRRNSPLLFTPEMVDRRQLGPATVVAVPAPDNPTVNEIISMSSIRIPVSDQVQSNQPRAERVYFASNGMDVIDFALSIDWLLELMQQYVATHGEDVAVWMREEGDTPRLIAFVRPAPHRSAEIKMI